MLVLRLFIQTGLLLVVMGLVLFVAGGNPAWQAAWGFLIEIGVLGLAVGLWLAWRDPELLAKRLGSLRQPNQPAWDRRFLLGVAVGFLVWLALMALDVQRWRLSLVPAGLQGVGLLAIGFSIWLSWRVFAANRFAAPVVAMQPRHAVIATGPYGVVRHPLYAGAIAFFIGAPLALGSWWGLAATPLLIGAVGLRALGEERMLWAELPGYDDYARKVRYRFVPRLW